MRELLRGYAVACAEAATDAGRLSTVATDLAGLSRALVSSDELRQVLIDPGIDVATRDVIARELLAGRAAPETVALSSFAIRYERAAELPVALASLVEFIDELIDSHRAPSAEDDGWLTGQRYTRERIRGYAERVLEELGALGEIDEVEDELFRIARLLDDHIELRQMLSDETTALTARVAVADDLLAQRCRPATMRLVHCVLRAGRARDLVGIFEWLVELAAAERGRRVADVRSAVALEQGEADRLTAALGRLVNRTVEVRSILDPSVIGGVLVSVGDLILDGTVRLRLERLRDELAQAAIPN